MNISVLSGRISEPSRLGVTGTSRYNPKAIQEMKHESRTDGAETNAPAVSKLVVPPCDTGRMIRNWRQRMGLTQEELAKTLSVTFSTVSRWENGHVQPSRLAWREMARLAADRRCALHEADRSDSSAPLEVKILRA